VKVKVVSNASPLITLARIGRLESLRRLFSPVQISTEVYDEIVVAGDRKPGALAVSKADWIQVSPVKDTEALGEAIRSTGLGAGRNKCRVVGQGASGGSRANGRMER
jgi:predicted nucleic acid-binding protein